MTPRAFASFQARRGAGVRVASGEGAPVTSDERVAVVLLAPGGVLSVDGAEDFLFRMLMDPYRFPARWLPVWARSIGARILARRQSPSLHEALHTVGGASPEARIVREQARALQGAIAKQAGPDVNARVYVASRYADPQADETLRRILDDGCDRVVLVPITPVHLSAVTDACLAWWAAVCDERKVYPPTTVVPCVAQSEGFAQAVSERLGEALHRFPRAVRGGVHLLFAAHPAAHKDAPDGQPDSSPLGGLARRVLTLRGETRRVHWCYAPSWGLNRIQDPRPLDALQAALDEGASGVLVVPLGYASDTLETAYELDIVLRERAAACGVPLYEIVAGMNCYALYIDTLASSVLSALGWQRTPVALAS
jgi:ferrochelatase